MDKKGKGKKDEKKNEKNDEATKPEEEHTSSAVPKEWIQQLEAQLNVGSAKNNQQQQHESGATAFAEPDLITMTQDQVDLVFQLCREKIPIHSIVQMMGVKEGTVDPLELKRVIMQAELSIAAASSMGRGEYFFHMYEKKEKEKKIMGGREPALRSKAKKTKKKKRK